MEYASLIAGDGDDEDMSMLLQRDESCETLPTPPGKSAKTKSAQGSSSSAEKLSSSAASAVASPVQVDVFSDPDADDSDEERSRRDTTRKGKRRKEPKSAAAPKGDSTREPVAKKDSKGTKETKEKKKGHKRDASDTKKELVKPVRDAHEQYADRYSVLNYTKAAALRVFLQRADNVQKKERHGKSTSETKIFEVPFLTVMERSAYVDPISEWRINAPSILVKSIVSIELDAMEEEGLYRVSGSHGRIKELKAAFDKGEDVSLVNENDKNAISGLLKLWLRELPDTIIPPDALTILEDICGSDTNPSDLKRVLKHSIPATHYMTVALLFIHLHRVIECTAVNLMTPANLAIVFSPTLRVSQGIVHALVIHADTVFESYMYDTYNALVRDARDIFMIDSLNTVEELREMHTRILCDDEEMKATNLKLVERLVRARRTRKELEDHLEAAVFDLMHTSVDEMLAVSSSDEEEEEEKEELEVVSEEGTEEKGEELPQARQGKSQDELRMERIVKRESRVMLVAERDKQRTVEELTKDILDVSCEREVFCEEQERLALEMHTRTYALHVQRRRAERAHAELLLLRECVHT